MERVCRRPCVRRLAALARASRCMWACRACLARLVRSASGSWPSGSTSRSNRDMNPFRPGSVRTVRFAVLAHDTCAPIRPHWAGVLTNIASLPGAKRQNHQFAACLGFCSPCARLLAHVDHQMRVGWQVRESVAELVARPCR